MYIHMYSAVYLGGRFSPIRLCLRGPYFFCAKELRAWSSEFLGSRPKARALALGPWAEDLEPRNSGFLAQGPGPGPSFPLACFSFL